MHSSRDDDQLYKSCIQELLTFFEGEGFVLHGAQGVDGLSRPPLIENMGFGSGRPHRPDVIAYDPATRRILFGLIRPDRRSLDSEESLEEYNVFLDHNTNLGARASVVYVLMPEALVGEFTSIITHYIHREYWSRIIPVGSRMTGASTSDSGGT